MGLVSVFKLLWAIPIAALTFSLRAGDRRLMMSMAVLLAYTAAQFAIADSSRLFTQAFMVMILALIELQRRNPGWLPRWGIPLLLLDVFLPQPFTAAQEVKWLTSLPMKLIQVFAYGQRRW